MLKRAKNELSVGELAKMHSKFKTARKHDASLAAGYADDDKKTKGNKALAWMFDSTQGPLYNSLTAKLGSRMQVEQVEKWKSERQMLTDFAQEEFSKHLQSGRILWQEDPCTPGVYQYKDTADWQVKRVVSREKDLRQEQRQEDVDSGDDEFAKIWGGISFSKAAMSGGDAWGLTDAKGIVFCMSTLTRYLLKRPV